MAQNLPATQTDAPVETRVPPTLDRPVNVAFLPLALVAFVVLAFIIAAWTFVATAL